MQIMRIARAVRKAADQLFSEDDCGMAMSDKLDGACADVSVVLQRMLGKDVANLVGGAYGGEGHAWVVLRRTGEILDLTVTQFGLKEKVFRSKFDAMYIVDPFIDERSIKNAWGDSPWRKRLEKRAKRILEGKR